MNLKELLYSCIVLYFVPSRKLSRLILQTKALAQTILCLKFNAEQNNCIEHVHFARALLQEHA